MGADANVQGSVASVLHNLSGEPLGVGAPAPGQDRPSDVFTPTSLSIDCRVPAKLKGLFTWKEGNPSRGVKR